MPHVNVGDKVRIKKYNIRPDFWNGDGEMDWLMGKVVEVYSARIDNAISVKDPNTGRELGWLFLEDHYDLIEEKMISIW